MIGLGLGLGLSFGGVVDFGPSSITVNSAGTTLTIAFPANVTGHAGFTLNTAAGTPSLTYVSGDGTKSLVYTIGTAVTAGYPVTLDYTPGNVTDPNSIAMKAFAGRSVTNLVDGLFVITNPDSPIAKNTNMTAGSGPIRVGVYVNGALDTSRNYAITCWILQSTNLTFSSLNGTLTRTTGSTGIASFDDIQSIYATNAGTIKLVFETRKNVSGSWVQYTVNSSTISISGASDLAKVRTATDAATFKSAYAAAVSGETIYLNSAAVTLTTAQASIDYPKKDGVHLQGNGKTATKITLNFTPASDNAMIPGSGSKWSNLTVDENNTPGFGFSLSGPLVDTKLAYVKSMGGTIDAYRLESLSGSISGLELIWCDGIGSGDTCNCAAGDAGGVNNISYKLAHCTFDTKTPSGFINRTISNDGQMKGIVTLTAYGISLTIHDNPQVGGQFWGIFSQFNAANSYTVTDIIVTFDMDPAGDLTDPANDIFDVFRADAGVINLSHATYPTQLTAPSGPMPNTTPTYITGNVNIS